MKNSLVVIHQPDFLPYLGFFHRLLMADKYVVLDHVQFVYGSRSWTNRDKIKTPKGAKWITVSTQKAPRNAAINEIRIQNDVDWKDQHIRQFQENYRKAQYYREIIPYLEQLYTGNYEMMMEFNLQSIKMLAKLLDVERDMYFSGQLNTTGKSNELLVDILNKVGSKQYLSGIGALGYYEPEVFNKAGIEVIWQKFTHPVYPQQFAGFLPNLSSIDLLMNCGIERSREILRQIN